MRLIPTVLAFGLITLSAAARAEPAATPGLPGLRLFELARTIELDASEGEVLEALSTAHGLFVEQSQSLPDGLSRVIVAVPEDDDCLPRGAAMVCPAIRVVMINDPARGLRVSRVEAFDQLGGTQSVAELLRNAVLGLGPPLQTESWGDQIRGQPRSVWRQRWRPDARENTYLEVVVTAERAPDDLPGLANPSSAAVGIGFVLVDPTIEDATLMARRRLICPSAGNPACR